MYDRIHIDEKWFVITQGILRTYLLLTEKDLEQESSNQLHPMKLMYLATVARPYYNCFNQCRFDGKTGMWVIADQQVAQRNSANQP